MQTKRPNSLFRYNVFLYCLCGLIASFVSIPGYSQEALKLLYIRAEFTDLPHPDEDSIWRDRLISVNKAASNYWLKHSYGTISSFNATITPIYTMPEPSTEYQGGGNTHKQFEAMKKLAADGGYNVDSYDHIIMSYLGGLNQPFGAAALPGRVWLPGATPANSGLIHEFGHSLGVGHANAIEGEGNAVYPGAHREGRDGLFMMGSDSNRRIGDHSTINLPMRYTMDFFDDRYLETVNTGGTFRIYAFEKDTLPSVKTLGVRVDVNGEDMWVTFAPTMVERWANFNSEGWARGVIVHRSNNTVTSILDFTPGSQGGTGNEADYIDVRDGALQIGSQFTFPGSEVTLKPLAVGETNGWRWIDVEVKTGKEGFVGTKYDIGAVAIPGNVVSKNSNYTIEASGKSIWGTADEFTLYSKPSNSTNGDIKAQVKSITATHVGTRAGLMIRESIDNNAKYAAIFVNPKGVIFMQSRLTRGAETQIYKSQSCIQSPSWLRLIKTGNKVTGQYSFDNIEWLEFKSFDLSFNQAPQLGIALTSHKADAKATAVFSNITAYSGTNNKEVYQYDFGDKDSFVEPGYQLITPDTQTPNYAWLDGVAQLETRDRQEGSQLNRDFIYSKSNAIFEHAVSNGIWEVSVTMGDFCCLHNNMHITAEDELKTIANRAVNEIRPEIFDVRVTDGKLTIEFSQMWVVNGVMLEKVSD